MSEPARYRKKPVVIEAMRLDGEAPTDANGPDDRDIAIASVSGWMLGHGFDDFMVDGERRPFGLAIRTLEGTMIAEHGDWIIRGVQGEFYPCKPDIFEATYELVNEPDTSAGHGKNPAESSHVTTAIERAAEAIWGDVDIPWKAAAERLREYCRSDARAALSAALDVDEMARVMADDWNPARDPILTAMFRDYAESIRTHLLGGDK